jgi:GH18 family chitinase
MLFLLLTNIALSQKLISYYPMWAERPGGPSPMEVDFGGIDFVVHFYNGTPVDPSTPPYFKPVINKVYGETGGKTDSILIQHWYTDCGPGCFPVNYQDSLIHRVHQAGGKILLDIQEVDPTNLNQLVLDSSKSQLFVDAVTSYINRKGYDGVEIDVESWSTKPGPRSGYDMFLRLFRRRLGQKTLAVSPSTGAWSDWNPFSPVDYWIIQCYEFHFAWNSITQQNVNWHGSPLFSNGIPPGVNGQSVSTLGPPQWVESGFKPSSIVIGIPTYGRILSGSRDLFQPWNGEQTYSKYADLKKMFGERKWDENAKVPYIVGDINKFGTYEDSLSVAYKIDFVRAKGYAGIMLYDMEMDWPDHELHRHAKRILSDHNKRAK